MFTKNKLKKDKKTNKSKIAKVESIYKQILQIRNTITSFHH